MGRRLSTRLRIAGVVLSTAAMTLGTLAAPAIAAPAAQAVQPAANVPVNVLVFHGPADQQADPVIRAGDAIAGLGQRNGMTVHVTEDPAAFTPANLANYRSVVILSAQGVTLTRDQETALQNYIKAGNGFLGVADAAKFQPDSAWVTGLIGTRPVGALPPPVPVSSVTASAENPPNETKEKLVDGNANTKWLAFAPTGWVAMRLGAATTATKYALTSANDADGRDPKNWTLQGSNDGTTWTTVDTQTNQVFPERQQRKEYVIANPGSYLHYKLDITLNAGDPITQLADALLYTADSQPPPEPSPQQAVVNILDRQHPANAGLPLNVTRTDRWRNWAPNPVGTVHTVAQVEERHFNPGPGAMGAFHPVSWCRDYEGGRSFFTGMGGTDASYGENAFRGHLLGALRWTTGMVRADCQATIAANYKVEKLTAQNQAGQLDQIGEPHGMTLTSDGSVLYVGKAACANNAVPQPNEWTNPKIGLGCGTIHLWDAKTKKAKLLATLPVMGNRGSGGELVKNEEGLLGIVLDPKFNENGWFYVYWMPHDTVDLERHTGKRTISRLTYDATNQTIDLASRKDLLQWEVQTHSCCHAGGGMAFDSKGNLYVGSGDSNSSQGAGTGYSGNNWTLEFAGISYQDARRTSGNTNDLNGKIIRIHPEADGTYTVPQGNLFAPGTDKTRPEIYVMGVRNISRLAIDPETDWLTAGWVGPDAGSPSPELGPAKYDTATIITEAGNHGWPYCMGNRQPYRDRSNTNAEVLTGWYDCDNPLNTSPRNTGQIQLPPIKDNMIWYTPDGGGPVFPKRPGSSLPTYNAADATYTEPWITSAGGCQAVMSGPTFHHDRINANSGVAWPKYWDDKWFIGDECTNGSRVAVTVDPAGVPTAQPPAFGETLKAIVPGASGDSAVRNWMDARFGPDGALYLLDYSGGFFTVSPTQKLARVTYQGGPPTPLPKATSVAVQDKPLTHQFNGTKAGGVSYQWEFGDGTTSAEANPRHTYTRTGPFTAKVTITYANGETAVSRVTVNVGCVVSDTSKNVMIDATDTTVPNKNAGGGCRVDDLIDDESTWATHTAFVSHVQDATRNLRQLGIINTAQRDKIVAAARASNIGKPGVTGYDSIYNGTPESLHGWSMAPSGEFVIQPDGSLRSVGGLGMLWYAQKAFGDFSLKLEFRDSSPDAFRANSGVFVRFPDPRIPLAERPPGSCGTFGPARTSPAWVAIFCGQEVQIYDGDTGEPQKTGSIYNFDPIGLDGAKPTPKGVWNTYEVKVVGQHYSIIRNGVVINEFDNTPGKQSSRPGDPPTDLRQFLDGFIGLQNHGNNDRIDFRNIRVRVL